MRGKNGCYKCSKFRSENFCRNIFEKIFDKQFEKNRFKFINKLELDGFNEEIKMAFEYQGKQHFEYMPYFHRNGVSDLEKQKERDKFKRETCAKQGITLIEIPYNFNYNNPSALIDFIFDQLNKTTNKLTLMRNADEVKKLLNINQQTTELKLK